MSVALSIALGVVFCAGLGIWSGHRKTTTTPDPRKIELASHLEAASTALAAGELETAARELAAAKPLDPANEKLGELQAALQQRENATVQAIVEAKAEKEALAREQWEKERLATLAQDTATAQKPEMLRKDFDAALAKTDAALSFHDLAAARQSLAVAQQLNPNDEGVAARLTRLAKLEYDMEAEKIAIAVQAKQHRKSPEKEPVTKAKLKPPREVHHDVPGVAPREGQRRVPGG